jgi:hypothetical protein
MTMEHKDNMMRWLRLACRRTKAVGRRNVVNNSKGGSQQDGELLDDNFKALVNSTAEPLLVSLNTRTGKPVFQGNLFNVS